MSTIFTRYGKPNMNKPSSYRYPKVIMDIRNNWIMDISIPNCICVIMYIHDSIMLIFQLWIIHNYTYYGYP